MISKTGFFHTTETENSIKISEEGNSAEINDIFIKEILRRQSTQLIHIKFKKFLIKGEVFKYTKTKNTKKDKVK